MSTMIESPVNLIAVIGPVGVFVLAAWWIWLRSGSAPRVASYHAENRGRLERIEGGVEAVLNQVMAINGRVRTLEQWQHDHEKHDDERHDLNLQGQGGLRQELHALREDWRVTREAVHAARNDISAYLLREHARKVRQQ